MRRRLITVLIVLLVSWGGLAVTLAFGVTPRLGLDLQGGTSVILTAPAGTDPEVVDVAVEIMRSRIEDFGIQEPEISVTSDRTVLVQLPGVTNPERALDAIGQTGELSFRPVLEAFAADQNPFAPPTTTTVPPSGPTTTRPGTPTTTSGASSTTEPTSTTAPDVTSTTAAGLGVPARFQATTTTAPATTSSSEQTTTTTPTTSPTIPEGVDPDTGLTIDDDPAAEAWLPQRAPEVGNVAIYHVGPAGLLGSDVADAIPGFQGTGATQGGWVVQLDLTAEGADQFADMTKQAAAFPQLDPRRQIAIVLDGEVISAPEVSLDVDPATGITGGQAIITVGGDDPAAAEQEAQDLAVVLRYGSLPVAFEQSSVQTVSATLGTDSLRAGLIAGLVGLAVVALYILIYYRALGVVGVIGFSVFGSLLLTIFSLLGTYRGLTLTLAGVTGIVISIGITADSYIVLFERIKDEARSGRTPRSAVEEGFRRAFRTVITADTVSLIGAVLLYFLAIGPVRGFALALGIATLLDIVVAAVYTRNATALLAGTDLGRNDVVGIRATAGLEAGGSV
ncbi:MAG TPA: protein translocase subunit SecD [Acidimicrobiia bacterium]|nr:protein translocase subunit SecD [Acidimicrobiia bacterium]